MFMTTKTITIMEDSYDLLLKGKRKNESFSELIRRTFKKGSIMEFAGAWSDMSDKEADELKARLAMFRARSDSAVNQKVKAGRGTHDMPR